MRKRQVLIQWWLLPLLAVFLVQQHQFRKRVIIRYGGDIINSLMTENKRKFMDIMALQTLQAAAAVRVRGRELIKNGLPQVLQ